SLYALNAFIAAIISASAAVLPSGIVAGAFGNGQSACADMQNPNAREATVQSSAFLFMTQNLASKKAESPLFRGLCFSHRRTKGRLKVECRPSSHKQRLRGQN